MRRKTNCLANTNNTKVPVKQSAQALQNTQGSIEAEK